MAFTLTKSQRGGDVLLYEGHEFLFQRLTADNFRQWKCRFFNKYHCTCKMITEGNRIIKEPGTHCHFGDSVRSEARKARADMREEARSTVSSTRNIVTGQLLQLSPDVMARLPKNSSLERAVTRVRKKANAPQANPQSRNFVIPEEYNDFVLYDWCRRSS